MKPTFKRFNELKAEDICFDFQMHTLQTDGVDTAEVMIARAKELKLKSIAITEHVRRDSTWFADFKQKMELIRGGQLGNNGKMDNENINIFVGIEAKPLDFVGTIDATEEVLDSADIVIGSVHRYPDGTGGLLPLAEVPNLGEEQAAHTEFRLAWGLLTNKGNKIDVLGHPFGVYSKFFKTFPEEYLEQLLIKSLERRIAIEISTKYRLEQTKLFALMRKINPYVSIGSDAHRKEDIARNFNEIRGGLKT